MTAIELDAVSKRWGDVVAVDGVSLAVASGALVALVGESGSGKSTTLAMVNRLIDADAGRVRIGGRDVRDEPPHELRRRIGYCFQQIGLFPHLSVADNVGVTPGLLVVQHAGGVTTRYAHLSVIRTRSGPVAAGTVIGLSGGARGAPGAGHSTGPHLHFEVRRGGTAIGPVSWMREHGVSL